MHQQITSCTMCTNAGWNNVYSCYCSCRLTPVSNKGNNWERRTHRSATLRGVRHAWCSKDPRQLLWKQHPLHHHHPCMGITALDLHNHLLLLADILQHLDLPWRWSELWVFSQSDRPSKEVNAGGV